MQNQILFIFVIQAIGAFILLAALFYFALGISGLASIGLSLLATAMISFWGYFRFTRYQKKRNEKSNEG